MKKWILTGLALLELTACQTPQQENVQTIEYVKRSKIKKIAHSPAFNYRRLTLEIENYFTYFASDDVLHQPDLVRKFYVSNKFQPHWIDISDTSQIAEYLDILASADLHGLDRNIYHYDRLTTNFENLAFFYFETGEVNYHLWAESELLLSDGLMLLSKHLKYGVFDPVNNEDYYYFIPPKKADDNSFDVFYADKLWPFFQSLVPTG
jgi:hypothetical protein